MLSTTAARRTTAALITTCALALAGSAAATSAGAATIRACVKKRSGATRFVGARTRCRRGEQKLSWNTSGPAGPAGASGPEGKAGAKGADGAVAAFAATGETVPFPAGKVTVLVSKTIPPGSYVLAAKTVLIAEASTNLPVVLTCGLTVSPGTAYSLEHTTLDDSGWESPLVAKSPTEFRGVSTVPGQGTVTSSATSTVAFACDNLSPAGVNVLVFLSQISAIQVSHIG